MTAPAASWAPRALALLRIVACLLYISHGTMKLFAFPASVMPNGGTVAVGSMFGAAAIIEIVGGTLVLAGLFTRPIAIVCSGEMAAAFFLVHFPQGFWPVLNKGEVAVLFCFIFLYLSIAGPGAWSLDAARSGKTATG